MKKANKQKFIVNLLKFTLPSFGVFLVQLQMGVDLKAALLVAGIALYQGTMDFLSKIK